MRIRSLRAPLFLAALLAVVAVAAPRPALAGNTKPQPSLLDRAKAGWNSAVKNVKGFGNKLLDFGEAIIDWTKKKWANLNLLKSLYGFLRGNPVIQWVSRTGQKIVRRLEPNPRAMAGRPTVTPDLPPFLKALADWRKKRGARR